MSRIFCLWLCWAVCLSAQDMLRIQAGVQAHVERLENSVPDFICDERIESRLYSGQKLKRTTRAEAVLATTRANGNFKESRSGLTIDGKRSKRNEISGPFVWRNGPAYGDLHFLFNSARGQECLKRDLSGPVSWQGKDALLLTTHAIPGVESDPACHNVRSGSADKIWLEPTSLNVIRIESHDPPTTVIPGSSLVLIVDYAPVHFDREEYWLPVHFLSRLEFPDSPKRLEYEASYANYHKFESTSVVHIDPNQ